MSLGNTQKLMRKTRRSKRRNAEFYVRVQRSGNLRRNPHNGVIRVNVDAEHDKALRLHLRPILKLTCVLASRVFGVNRCLTLLLNQCYAQTNKMVVGVETQQNNRRNFTLERRLLHNNA
jgi:hypothetical protein